MTEKYIGVNEFISTLKEMQKEFGNWSRSFGKTATCVLEETINKLQSFPAADVEPIRHGHFVRWYTTEKNHYSVTNTPHCKCSECGCILSPYDNIEFCPKCGARMDEEIKDNAELC